MVSIESEATVVTLIQDDNGSRVGVRGGGEVVVDEEVEEKIRHLIEEENSRWVLQNI